MLNLKRARTMNVLTEGLGEGADWRQTFFARYKFYFNFITNRWQHKNITYKGLRSNRNEMQPK